MATIDLGKKTFRIGFWGKINVTQPQSSGDSLGISDSIVVRVMVRIADELGISDRSPVRQFLVDVIVFFEELSARVKGRIQTLFISDDRYFRKRG